MLLLDLSDDLLDRVLYLALLQPKFYTYDKNYDEVLYPRLVLVRAVCHRFNQEYVLTPSGSTALTAVGQAAEQLRAAQRRHICFILEALVIAPIVHSEADREARQLGTWECIGCGDQSSQSGGCIGCGCITVPGPGTISEDEQLEYARAAYGYYGDRYDGCDWPGIGEHASHFCL